MGMNLNDDDIREFCNAWREEFGEPLSPDEARHRASLLLDLYVTLARPLPESEHKPPKAETPNHLT
jgi:hypothetical protein